MKTMKYDWWVRCASCTGVFHYKLDTCRFCKTENSHSEAYQETREQYIERIAKETAVKFIFRPEGDSFNGVALYQWVQERKEQEYSVQTIPCASWRQGWEDTWLSNAAAMLEDLSGRFALALEQAMDAKVSDTDAIYIKWGIEDITTTAEDNGIECSDDEARVILAQLDHDHNAEYGLTNGHIYDAVTRLEKERATAKKNQCN